MTTISFVITRADLLAATKEQADSLMKRIREIILNAMRFRRENVRLGNVHMISAHRGWWTTRVKEEIRQHGGGVWIVGKANVGKISPVENEKILSEDFIDIILLNAVLPLKYAYYRNHDEEITDKVLELYSQIGSEKNVVISKWKKLGIAPKNALESQGLLHHYKNFCTAKKCLNCSIGYQLMKVKNEGA